MKKISSMRVAAIVLALVLVTSCFVGGTFAKYVAKATGEAEARVAYWGFEATTIEIDDLFDHDDNGILQNGLIAPGSAKVSTFGFEWTSGSGAAAPEVDYTFDVTVTGDCAQAIKDNPNIKWSFDGNYVASFDALLTAIDDLASAEVVEAGNLPTNFQAGKTHSIGWEWAFETADNGTTPENELDEQDKKDTLMGNNDTALEANIAITVTAVQLNGTVAPPITTAP